MQERKEKQDQENQGGPAVMKRVGGEKEGLPFLAFLSPSGDMIANSIRPPDGKDKGGNIGHPFEPKEVDWFLDMVHKAAPSITAEESKTLEDYLRAQKK